MGIGAGETGELVAGFEGDTDAGGAAEVDEAGDSGIAAGVAALAGDADVVQLTRTGADGLLDGVEAVKNFHESSLLSKWTNSFVP